MSTFEVVLTAHGLSRSFGSVRALDGLSLELSAGEIYGLVGPDGAGKTTAIRIMAGVMEPNGGTATILGMNPLGGSAKVRSALGYMPQQYSLYGDLTVEENLRFFSHMFCLSRSDYRERRERLLEITRLERFTDRRADALSGGMYKKLALACSLLPRPKVLLLDEPTNGVDPVSRRDLWALLFELASEGMAVLVSTAYMDEAERCHRVGLLDEGRLLLEGPPRRLLEQFPHRAFEVVGGDRSAAEQLGAHHPAILAQSFAGADLRVVIRAGAEDEVRDRFEGVGAELILTRPSFEDLFLSSTVLARRAQAATTMSEEVPS